ncbi:MAG TPA: OmpA family protein, partial [Chitinophagales bacterium]|nr:OmpA family protein [Chitinophagales bacterium]
TACNRPTGLGSCDIFYSIKHNDQWTEPAGIGAPINSTDWESQPYITGNGMSVIFSSNRPGGFGGKDLYISHLSKENKWLEPQNLGSTINTSGDEETPFLHADGKTLFFSSNGHPSIGGKDLYMSRLSDSGVWSEPVNLGYPINTEENESSIYISIDGKTAFMASDRVEGKGGLDIYEFELHEAVQAQTATYVKAIVKDAKTKQRLSVEYSVFEFENNSLFASGKTRQLGEFLITMPTDKTYRLEIGKKGYVFHSERFLAEEGSHLKPFILEVYLQPIEEGASIVLQNVLFKTDSHILEEASFPELQKVAELMHSDKNISAIIKGHTDDVGDAEYNLSLSQKRAQSVVEYLVGEGVAKERLTTQGYGESQPLKPNTSDENRQINRRTEFEIIKN